MKESKFIDHTNKKWFWTYLNDENQVGEVCKYLADNNLKIEIKAPRNSVRTSLKTEVKYYVSALTKKEKETADVVIIYVTKQFYIIPIKKVRGSIIYIRDTLNSKAKTAPNTNKYWEKYKNNWNLLDLK